MTTTEKTSPAFGMGRVIRRTFDVIGRNLVTFLLLAVLAEIPNFALALYSVHYTASVQAAARTNPMALLGLGSTTLLAGVAGFALQYVLNAALAHGTLADLTGKRASFGECLGTGLRNLLPLVGMSILAYLGIVVGFVLLIVPGIILSLAWAVLVQVRVVEHLPVLDTFGRSWDLTRGHRWAILGLFVVYAIAAYAIWLPINLLVGGALIPTVRTITNTYQVVSGVVRIVATTVLGTGTASVYYELRSIKEGIGPEQLAAVFD